MSETWLTWSPVSTSIILLEKNYITQIDRADQFSSRVVWLLLDQGTDGKRFGRISWT